MRVQNRVMCLKTLANATCNALNPILDVSLTVAGTCGSRSTMKTRSFIGAQVQYDFGVANAGRMNEAETDEE